MDSPKERFRKSLHSKGWNDVVDSAQFQSAADAAVLEFHSRLGTPSDMGTSAANEWKRQGARDFLHVLMTLTAEEQPKRKPTSGTLSHTV